jgi:hypothetical protein
MANPNLASMASFYLEGVYGSISSSTQATLIANASGSGEVLVVFSAIFANIDASAAVEFTLDKFGASGTAEIAKQVFIPVKDSEALITEQWPVVLMEGECLRRQAGVGGDSSYVISYRKYA